MKNMKTAAAILGFLAAAIALPAAAQQDKGIYLGGSAGLVQYKDICANVIVPCDERDPGYRVFGGYRFSRAVSVEAGYADIGPARGDGPAGTFIVKNRAIDVVGVFSFQVANRLSAIGKLGIYRTRTTMDENLFGVPNRYGSTSTGWSYGAGLQYDLGRFGVRAEWQRWDKAGTGGTSPTINLETDIDMLSLGMLFRF